MDIKVSRDELFKAVSKVQSIIEKRSNMPILSTILIKAGGSEGQISATDLEIGLQQVIPAHITKEGSITISGRKLFEIIKESKSSDIHIKEKENNWVFISDDVARFDLACLPPDDYPVFFEPEGVETVSIDGSVLNEMIDKTIYAVTREDAGYKLSGVFTEIVKHSEKPYLRMVATDGHRLSMIDKLLPGVESLELGNGIMIPKKGMTELNKIVAEGGPVQLGFKEKNCVAKRENSLLIIRLLEAKFPDYQSVIPKEEKYLIKVERIPLIDAMRKMLILSNERYRGVKLTLANNTMELVSTNPDLGEAQENIEIEHSGERLEAGFNPQYFIDILQSMESDVVVLGFVDSLKSWSIKGDADEGFLGLLMPMKA
jgi:DNA polymerase-3 subunit beta